MKYSPNFTLLLLLSFFSLTAQNTIWDYMGIWQFSQGRESLNISKPGILNDLTIQYNSYSDGFEDRGFQNCKFIDGKIIADYYGGKNNVIITKKDKTLYLTIKPFHQFQPIINQPFAFVQKTLLKYVTTKESTQINNTSSKWLVPGELILVAPNNTNKLVDIISSTEGQISLTKLNSIKPLFISKHVNQKGIQRFNTSEQFIKKLYDSLNKNVFDFINKDNSLMISKTVYEKLQLFKIAPYPNKYAQKHHKMPSSLKTVMGTVDLDPNFHSIVVKYQYENEYNTYLVNYDLSGEFKGMLKIASGDYVESFTITEPEFTTNGIFVNSYAMDDSNNKMVYKLHKSERYILANEGYFLNVNHTPEQKKLERKIHSQKIESKTLGQIEVNIYLEYHSSKEFATRLFSTIIKDNVEYYVFPFDLNNDLNYTTPYYKYATTHNGLEKLMNLPFRENDVNHISEFWDRDYNTHHLNLNIELDDVNNDGHEDLLMSIEDRSYVVSTKHHFCFINKDYQWVSSPFTQKVNTYLDNVTIDSKLVFKSLHNSNKLPIALKTIASDKPNLLLNSNENLVYSFKIKGKNKRVTIAVDENEKYYSYKYGNSQKIDFEYTSFINTPLTNFSFYSEDHSATSPRYTISNLSFTTNGYEYTIFNNYTVEIDYGNLPKEDKNNCNSWVSKPNHITLNNGIGIRVRQLSNNKITVLEADSSTVKGYLEFSKYWSKINLKPYEPNTFNNSQN